jgi:metallo-beta-lactamase class B
MRTLACLGLLLSSLHAETSPALPPPPARDAAIRMFEAWKAPVPPRQLVGNIYYVGAIGVSSFLITSSEGHVLIDTGFEETVPLIQRSVEQLGFKVADIKFILSSHAHIDHTGGHARMKRLTGAKVIASAEDARVLASGGADDFLTWPRETIRYEPVEVDRTVGDGEKVTLGGTSLTANLTPGHTRGATTWTMDVDEGGRTYRVVFFSSASVNDGTRLLNNPSYPGIVTDLEASFARFRGMTCDIFLAPHGGQFAMADKFARLDRGEGVAALIDPAGWKELIAGAEKQFRDLLARERSLATP